MQASQTSNEGPPKRLYRSRVNRMISGICGGLGEYLNVDPVIIRIIFILLTLFGGGGLILYLIGIFVIPENPEQGLTKKEKGAKGHAAFWGWVLVILGALLLIPRFTFMPPIDLWNLPWETIWAVLFILLGLFLLLKNESHKETMERGYENTATNASQRPEEPPGQKDFGREKNTRQLYRSRKDRMISGVCGGLAEYFNMDSTVVRLIFVLLTLFSKGLGVIAYIILILAVPEEKPSTFKNGDPS